MSRPSDKNGMPMQMQPQGMPQMDPKQMQTIQMMSRMATQMREQMEAESLIKPADQDITADQIQWCWYLPNGRLLKASIHKVSKNFEVEFVGNSDRHIFDADEAKVVGDSISSAARWKELWKQHAGEYLIDEDEDVQAAQRFE